MRTIIVHTGNFASPALESFRRYAKSAEYVETKGLYGYNDAIASRWDGSDSLVVIEQDKEITAEVLPSLESCDQPWCTYSAKTFPEPYTKTTIISLSCARFSVEVQKVAQPDFYGPDLDYHPKCKRCDGKGCWVYLDTRIAMALMAKGYQPHVHGEIKHHHEYPPADEWLEDLNNQFEFTESR